MSSPKLIAIIERNGDELDEHKFDSLVRDALREGILDELLDEFYRIDITIPPEVVTEQLHEFYVKKVVKSEAERERYLRKINYLINKHQVVIVKTLDVRK